MAKLSPAGVLRLRAPSAVLHDQSVRRFAQNDDSVGELTERTPLRGSRQRKFLGCAPPDDKWRVVTSIKGRQTGQILWGMDEKRLEQVSAYGQQVLCCLRAYLSSPTDIVHAYPILSRL